MRKISFKISENPWFLLILELIVTLAALGGSFFVLEYSMIASVSSIWIHLAEMDIRYILLNLLSLGLILSALLIVSNRLWLSCLLTSVVSGIIALINYYVIQFHGMPLSFLVIKNFKTAMNVIGSYQLKIDQFFIKIAVVVVGLVVLSLLLWKFVRRRQLPAKRIWFRNALLFFLCMVVIRWGYTSPTPVKPPNTVHWSWQEAYYQYGYVPCTVETFLRSRNVVTRPEDYSPQKISQITFPEVRGEQQQSYPDIVLILNESFYDLRQITDPQTDNPYLSNIESMENVRTGYAVVPNNGGGTNASEYELLTSNSMQLMPGVTPFNAMNLSGANSVVSYLKHLGYYTAAAHCMDAANYSRIVGYRDLGFDNSYFSNDFFVWDSVPGRVYNSDQANYENLISWYDMMPEEQPRFFYLLTIQNHGDWDHCPNENDIVHAQRDFGEYEHIVDEYLTCIYYSDQAFRYLTDRFAETDRPVIVCMVGDHAPSFAASLADSRYSGEEKNLRLRKVPLMIWANYDLEDTPLGTLSLNYVVPTLLETAGMQGSPYYSYMLDLKQQVPILSAFGKYFDAEGNGYDYRQEKNAPFRKLVDDYFNLEYHNIHERANREIYQPPAS